MRIMVVTLCLTSLLLTVQGQVATAADALTGDRSDLERAVDLFRSDGCEAALPILSRLSDVGSAPAQYRLAQCYYLGRGAPQDSSHAARLFQSAARQNLMYAQQNLGAMYASGEGLPQNPALAVFWFQRAADQGDAFAQLSLGRRYLIGDGVAHDIHRAENLLIDAATQGLPEAQYTLSVFYAQGLNGKPDFHTALSWSQRAADQGFAPAAFNVAVAYQNGQGAGKDPAKSYFWLLISAQLPKVEGSTDLAETLASFRGNLTAGVVASATRQAADWLAVRAFDKFPMRAR